jgi:hypothetical protein
MTDGSGTVDGAGSATGRAHVHKARLSRNQHPAPR